MPGLSVGDLPLELLIRIATLIDTASLLALRNANHSLEAATFEVFKARCIRSRKTDLTEASLERLNEIATYPQFGECIRQLDVIPAPICLQFGNRWVTWQSIVENNPLEPRLAQLRALLQACRITSIKIAVTLPSGEEQSPYTDVSTACDSIELIFRLITEGLVPFLEKLDIDLLRGSNPGWLQEARLNIQLYRASTDFWAQWAQLRELRLNVTAMANSYGCAAQLVTRATGLQRLALNPGNCYGSKFLASVLADQKACRELRCLAIAGFSTSVGDVVELLRRSKMTLVQLELDVYVYDTEGSEGSLAGVEVVLEEMPLLDRVKLGPTTQASLGSKRCGLIQQQQHPRGNGTERR